jgi:hypothetical protein
VRFFFLFVPVLSVIIVTPPPRMAEGDMAEEGGTAASVTVIDVDATEATATAMMPLRILRLLCTIVNINMFIQSLQSLQSLDLMLRLR